MNLYEITIALREAIDAGFDPETGEMLPAFEDNRALFEGKGAAVAAYIINTELEAEKCALAIARIAKVKASYDKKSIALRDYLSSNMKATNITEIKGDALVVKRSPEIDQSVLILDAMLIPASFTTLVPESRVPDKRAIKKEWKEGRAVTGTQLVKKDRLTIK